MESGAENLLLRIAPQNQKINDSLLTPKCISFATGNGSHFSKLFIFYPSKFEMWATFKQCTFMQVVGTELLVALLFVVGI